MRRAWPAAGWLVLGLAVADWILLRRGIWLHSPELLALLVGLAGGLFLLRLTVLGYAAARGDGRTVRSAGEVMLLAGALTALGGGTVNWLLSLQGVVILVEGETVPLSEGSHLQGFEAGPLARASELGLRLALREVELVPSGGDRFYPRSQLLVARDGEEPQPLEVTPGRLASYAPLRFHQGAFGFAPRVVVQRDGATIFDQVVPFLTERRGSRGLSFGGRFGVEAEDLSLEGSVDLSSLDEALRGHVTLGLVVYQGDHVLGSGALLPGHFAELEEGYRVGFVGLEKWSEILVSRRGYDRVIRGGFALAALGALLWPVAVWRRW